MFPEFLFIISAGVLAFSVYLALKAKEALTVEEDAHAALINKTKLLDQVNAELINDLANDKLVLTGQVGALNKTIDLSDKACRDIVKSLNDKYNDLQEKYDALQDELKAISIELAGTKEEKYANLYRKARFEAFLAKKETEKYKDQYLEAKVHADDLAEILEGKESEIESLLRKIENGDEARKLEWMHPVLAKDQNPRCQ